MSTIPSARLMFLKDLHNVNKGESVRITGLWAQYNVNQQVGLVTWEADKVEIDMQKCLDYVPTKGDLVQVLGEVNDEATFGVVRICARIVRYLETLDMDLYEKVVNLRNNAL